MKPDKENLRESILLAIELSKTAGFPPNVTLYNLRKGGHPGLSEEELAVELDYLVGKGLLVEKRNPIAAAKVRHTLAPAGRDYLEERGLL